MTDDTKRFSFRYDEEFAVAFLDLLGFKHFLQEDLNGATELLENHQTILSTKLADNRLHPPESYPRKDLADLARETGISVFDIAVPFSDSLVLLSRDPSLFASQLGHFIADCFNYTAGAYQSGRQGDPTEVEIPIIERAEDGHLRTRSNRVHWYPTLYRGGLAYGQVRVLPSRYLLEGNAHPLPNILGLSYVRAYQYQEQGGKGPRLFCHSSFVDKADESIRRYVVPVVESSIDEGVSELVWPALLYIEGNNPEIEANDIGNLIRPVLALADHFNTGEAHEHYEEFLRLLARGALLFFRNQGCDDLAISKLRGLMSEYYLRQIPEWPR